MKGGSLTIVDHCAFACARSTAWVVGPLVISLIVSTVCCRYHYAIDVLTGIATAAILIPVWRRINPALRPRQDL